MREKCLDNEKCFDIFMGRECNETYKVWLKSVLFEKDCSKTDNCDLRLNLNNALIPLFA